MKTLYLVRHAKSDWDNDAIQDIERPLNERGYRDANTMGNRLKEKKLSPDLIICSPAIRTTSTALIFARTMEKDLTEVRFVDLYEKSVADYKKVIAATPDSISSLMLFGHNPTISGCATAYISTFMESMNTAGIVCIAAECDSWKDFDKSQRKLVFYDQPKG
jgi:phosphohistidine phosphatase